MVARGPTARYPGSGVPRSPRTLAATATHVPHLHPSPADSLVVSVPLTAASKCKLCCLYLNRHWLLCVFLNYSVLAERLPSSVATLVFCHCLSSSIFEKMK